MSGTTEWGVAWKKKSVWGDPAPTMAAGDLLLIESESMPDMVPEAIDDASVGDALTQGSVQGNFPATEGGLVIPVRYEGVERILALFMGLDTKTDAPGETSGTARQHEMIFQDSNSGKFGSLVIDKAVGAGGPWEYRDAKISQIALTHADGKLKLSPTLIPSRIDRSADQTNSSLSGVTAPSLVTLALFPQLRVYLKEITGSEDNLDLADDGSSADEICVTNVNFNANRQQTGLHESCSQGAIGEPQTDGLPTAELTLSIADYSAALDALIEAAQIPNADREPTRYKLTLRWRGGTISGSDSSTGEGTGGKNIFMLQLDLPSVVVMSAPVNAGSPGSRASYDLGLKVVTPNAAIDGSDWSWTAAGSKPFRFLVYNENDTAMS
jgi:hypothetical protein